MYNFFQIKDVKSSGSDHITLREKVTFSETVPNLSDVPFVCHKEHLYGQMDLYETLSIKLALEALDSATHSIDTQISPYKLLTSLPGTQDSEFYKKQNVTISVSFSYTKMDNVLVRCH